jgi:ABC-type transport system substrate-binding protein
MQTKRSVLMRGVLGGLLLVGLLGQATPDNQASETPTTQPAATTQPADDSPSELRRPAQADILRGLLRRGTSAKPTPISPTTQPDDEEVATGADGQPLLLEGTFLIERPGRLVREGDVSRFQLYVAGDGESQTPRLLEILPNQLLESLEREAEAGFSEFIISAEVTRYRGRNYLLLRKILRRVEHGNLGP